MEFSKVKAEMRFRHKTLADLSEAIGCTPSTLSQKLNCKTVITFDEAMGIKAALGCDMPLEELFAQYGKEGR